MSKYTNTSSTLATGDSCLVDATTSSYIYLDSTTVSDTIYVSNGTATYTMEYLLDRLTALEERLSIFQEIIENHPELKKTFDKIEVYRSMTE